MNANRLRPVAIPFVLFVALAAVVTLAQQQPPAQAPAAPARPAAVPELPVRGTLTVSDADRADILSGLKAPAGFKVTVFGAPPIVNYPTCLTAGLAGEVYVCVDRNGSLQADPGMGSILKLVDKNGDGQADEYTVFATLDSPRGVVFDGQTLYVSHPPLVTALRDVDGDGIAEDRRTLVRGLGFGLDFRGADHTTNGIEQGIDGWLYVAVGDYGAVKATGRDGTEIQMRGGGNVRVRPDGSDLEIYTRGTRNDYDLAIDPYMNMFARGNTNDGGGFDIRMYHFVSGARFGYPSLFRNFGDEVIPPLADYGTGSGTGMLFVDDPGLPTPYGNALYSVDWGRNIIYRHLLTPKGATFAIDQETFLTVPRPNDMTIDGQSKLYVASWRGGQFRYAGENIGYVAALTPEGKPAPPPPDLTNATDARLVELIASNNQTHRRFAQQALLRRGRSPERISLLSQRILGTGAPAGRVSAIFALKQLAGADAQATLVKAAGDPAVRAYALRALADRKGELTGAPKTLFVQALTDADPRVQLQALTGLKRLGAVDAAKAMIPLTASPDVVVANIAIEALVSLQATDAALTAVASGPAPVAKGALRVLQQIHTASTVTGLISSLTETRTPEMRSAILQSLARLYHHEGVWRGTLAEWWGTRPDTTGPYYDPVAWEESARIRPVLRAALLQPRTAANAAELTTLLKDLERNRVLPAGAGELLGAMATASDPALATVADAMLGRSRLEVDAENAAELDRLAKARPEYRAGVVKIIAAAGPATPQGAEIMRQAAIDQKAAPAVRATALTTLAAATGPGAAERSIEAFSSVNVTPDLDPALGTAWRTYIASPNHATNLAAFRTLTTSTDPGKQMLGYAVLLRLAADPPAGRGGRAGAPGGGGGGGGAAGRGGRGGANAAAVEAARTEARAAIEAAWSGPSVPVLLRAIGATESAGYRDRVTPLTTSTTPAVRDAAVYAASKLPADAPAAAPAAGAAAPVLVSAVPFETLDARIAATPGDVAVGRTLFTRQGCAACHTTTAGEPEKGPFLGGITTRYSRAELIESIVRPAAKVAQGFATYAFETKDGRLLTGFVIREGTADVVLRDIAGVETTLQKTQIATRRAIEGSIMPAGLADTLTLQELSSLLAFLGSTTGK